jgi:hypothetical protein
MTGMALDSSSLQVVQHISMMYWSMKLKFYLTMTVLNIQAYYQLVQLAIITGLGRAATYDVSQAVAKRTETTRMQMLNL